MGRKYGHFCNMEGGTITVSFNGAGVSSGAIDVVNVVLQMDGGGGQLPPVQYTTASITVVSDGWSLIDLAALYPRDIEVEVTGGAGEVLFVGYVTPNTFNQPCDGINDELTIECVDWLGIAQYVPYRRTGDEFRTLTIAEAVNGIMSQVSDGLGFACYMADNVLIRAGDGKSTRNYTGLQLAESYFYDAPTEPTVMPDGSLNIDHNALSCYDALAMIADTFLATWRQQGRDIYMIDVLALSENGEAVVSKIAEAGAEASTDIARMYSITEESFAASGSNVSILPRCDEVVISRAKAATPVLVNAFKKEHNALRGARLKELSVTNSGDPNKVDVKLAQLLTSRVFDLNYGSRPNPDISTAEMVGYCTKTVPMGGWVPENLETLTTYGDDGWETALRLYTPAGTAAAPARLKRSFVIPTVPGAHYSLRFKCSVAVTDRVDIYSPTELRTDISGALLFVQLECDGKYYDADVNKWTSVPMANPVYATPADAEWKDVVSCWNLTPVGVLAASTASGPLVITIGSSNTAPTATDRAVYVKNFEVELTQDYYADLTEARFWRPEVIYRGERSVMSKTDEVEQPLSYGFPTGAKPLSTEIDGVDYARMIGDATGETSYVDTSMFFVGNEGNYDFADRLLRLKNIGDGREVQFTLRDDHNATSVVTAYTAALWSKYKFAAGFIKDFANSSITVIVN